MGYIAIDILEKSYYAAEKVLMPFSFSRWLRLIVMAFFTGGSSGFSTIGRIPGDAMRAFDMSRATPSSFEQVVLGSALLLLLPFILVILLFSLVFMYLRGVFTFMYFDSIDSMNVDIRHRFRKFKRLGWSYFLYALTVSLIVLAIVGLVGATIVFAFFSEMWVLGVLLIPLLVLILLALALFFFILEEVVVPTMYLKKLPFMKAYRKAMPAIKKSFADILLYLIIRWLLGIGAALFIIAASLILLIPFGLISVFIILLGVALASVSPVLATPLLIIAIPIFLAILIAYSIATMFVSMPITTYFMAFKLLFTRRLLAKKKSR